VHCPILPEANAIGDVKLDPPTCASTPSASGAAAEHVNKTDSAVRITHLPTGIVVEVPGCRSQHKNRESARRSRCAHQGQAVREQREGGRTRKSLIGSGDRRRIRTTLSAGRVTDIASG